MTLRFAALPIFLFLFSPWVRASALYTMEDLKVLESNGNSAEFFQHAKDVRPSLRGELWGKMVSSMADQYIKNLQAQASISDADFDQIESISAWAPLKEDEFFSKKRNAFALKYLDQCLKQKEFDSCRDRLYSFFISFEKEREFGVEILKRLLSVAPKSEQAHGALQSKLWPFAAPMAQSSYGEFFCDKEPLFDFVTRALAAGPSPESVAHKDCLKSLAKKAQASLTSSNLSTRNASYLALEKLGALELTEKAKHLITQLLSGGHLNEAKWGEAYQALKSMGQNQQARKDLLSRYEGLSTLPDKIFADTSKKRVMVITKQLAKNFPEFMDFYTGQCLKWLAGEKDFPRGNPTPNCHEYFKLAKIIESSPSSVTKRYDQIMNSWR